jgi:hypothetical protein
MSSFIFVYMYKVLAYVFYYIGDIACMIPTGWGYSLYLFAMKKSIQYDEVSGNNIWLEVE